MVKRALLIGINYFGTDCELSGCIDDIEDVRAYLTVAGYSEFTVLADDASVSPLMPTRANILAAIDKCVAATRPGDILYVHYSGHGSYVPDLNGDEKDGNDECICPVDYDTSGMITDDTLNDALVKKLPQGASLRAVFDACHSGTCLDLPYRWVSGANVTRESADVIKDVTKDVVFISGCKDDQTSADSTFNNRANGALTWSLLKSLGDVRKSGKHAGTYRWIDLIELMRLRLKKGGYDQVPQLCFESKDQPSKYVDI